MSLYLTFHLENAPFTNEYKTMLEKCLTIFPKGKELSKNVNVSTDVLSLITYSLNNIKKNNMNLCDFIKIGSAIMTYLSTIDTINIDSDLHVNMDNYPIINFNLLSQNIADYFQKLFSIFLVNEPVIQPNIEIKMDDNPYNFCNIVFISKQLVVPKPLSAMPIKLMPEVTPAIFKNRVGEYYNDCYHDISKLYNSFKLTLNKHNDLMANIIDYIMYLYQIDQLSISKHYFTMSVLVLCDPLELSNYFEKSSKWNTILNERAFVKMEKYDDDLIKMAEKIIINCFLYTQSIQFWLLETLFGLLFTCHMPYILNMLKYLFIHNKAKFIAIVKRSDSNLIDILYLIDGRIKSFLLKNDNSDLIEIRSSIFSMIYEFSQTEVIEKLIHDENKCGNLLSLSLELAIQPAVMNILQNALISKSSATISESIGGYFFASTKDIKQDRNWQNLIQLLMHSIEESLPKNSILICQSFLKSSLIESLNKIASESSSPEFCLKIFSFIVKMCCNSKQFSNDISTRKCNFYEIWKEILSKNRIENDTIDLLKKLTFLGEGTLIQNQEGLRLLVYLTKSTSYFSEMIKLLTQICEMSLINRYRCSIADLGSFLLDIFKENGDEMILNLIKTIGSSFLSPNELNSFIRFLKLNSSNPKVLSLLKTLNEIIINSSLNPEKTSFFHIEEKNYKFMLDSITLSDKISFSFSIRLDSQARNKKYLIFSLMNERQVISMMFDHLLIILNIGSSTFNIRAEISTNVWNTFYFNLNKHNVSLSMNNTKLYETKLPKKFKFNPPFVKFTMSGSICDLEDICFYENQKVVAHYSGKVEEDGICPNIAQNSDSFGAAQFIGMTVPYTLRIFNSISNIGGINIFLPLFYSGDKSCDKTQFILLLLQSICNIISKDENLFIEHQFFRTLSSLLPPETTTDIMSCFLEIYQTIKSQELKTEILIHIFGNWSLIKTFNDEVHRALLSKIYKLVANSDIQLFFKVNPVRKLILAFESILSNPDAIKNAWKFIESMIILAAQTHFLDEKDIMILFSATNNPNVVHLRNCLDAIDKLIRNTDLVNTYLEKHDYFKSLFHILSKNDNSLNASVFTLFNTISNAFPESSLSKNITYSFSLLRPNNETLNILSSFIFMESSNPPKIQNAHFIPYLCSIIYFYSSDKIQMTLDNVIGSLELDDDSAINMAKCENWPFWLLFLTNMDNKQQLWIKNIARISLVSESLGRGLKFEEIKQVFNVFAQSFDLRYDLMMKQFILSLIELDKNRHFGQQISTEIFQYIFFDHSIPLSNQDAFCIVKDNLVHFVQYVIHKEWLPSSFNFSLTVFNNYKMKDTFMQEFALKYCLEANKTFINESIVLSYEEIPVIYFVALLIHSISMAGNKDLSRSYFEKFLSIKSKQKSKKLLSFSFLDFKNETKLIKKHCDNNSEPLNLYLLMKEEALKYQSKFFEKTHNYIESLELVFKPIYDYDILNQNLPDIPDTNELLLLLQSEFDIKMRQNNSLCKSTLNDLKHTSILWSNSSRKLHWKTDNVIDIFGRKMKMKQNYDFDDHKDASAARNNDLSQNLEMSHNRSSFLELEDEVPDNDIQVVSIMHFNSTMVTLTANYKGVIHFTSNSLLFLSKEITNEFGQETEKIVQKTVEIPISSFSFAMKRRFLHKDIAAEVFTKYCKSYLFFFESKSKRRLFLKKMNGLGTKIFRAKNITEKTKL
ncbi:hypothetical protein TRFO_10658 [Tritrichomonas foetus]|uniref:BEACH-type PH domain-containing protein n=1 Tax=Tritrichomonas foetus TaxID=1144522 RepID=A0A1J4J7H8_9EUKA|nr:hypothetical protein TRFO_10658 [Tritrichomonas foetus]|eukprot:OHS95170.1 hypothetical protein TRFO_10658 [Tritrichomonas foetus]